MTFALPLALLLALAVSLPLLAHALRRGRAQPFVFPAARLVQAEAVSAKEKNRLEDRALLSLRMLTILSLALLAASPFVSCSRLSLTRSHGASVSASLIVDDSASMRAVQSSGKTRLALAIEAAKQLLNDAQPGDSFSLVLAGAPARVVVPPTADVNSVKDALLQIAESDRATDLSSALALAQSLQKDAVQKERPLILLSDLSNAEFTQQEDQDLIVPQIGLTEPLSNCAISSATNNHRSVVVELVCTSVAALQGRSLRLLSTKGEPLGAPVPAQDGTVLIPLPKENKETPLDIARVELSAPEEEDNDQIRDDDSSFLLQTSAGLSIALRADSAKSGLKTGTETVLQSGIEALERGIRVEPLSLLPDEASDLSRFAGLIIDDPSGFSPEVRRALEQWVKSGGVAATFIGPGAEKAPLGSNFMPFLSNSPRWIKNPSPGSSADEAGSLGPLSTTWNDLEANKRAHLQLGPDYRVLTTWSDGAPLVAAQSLGQGLLLLVSLPSSIDHSDLALRPAFLELLDYIVSQSALRKGAAATAVGNRWHLNQESVVEDPLGQQLLPLNNTREAGAEAQTSEAKVRARIFEPALAGVYRVNDGKISSFRYAIRHASEHISQPQNRELSSSGNSARAMAKSDVGISREIALLVLILGFLELLFRVFRPQRGLVNLPAGVSSAKVSGR